MKITTVALALTALLFACSSEAEQVPVTDTASNTGTEASEMVAADGAQEAQEPDEGPSEKAEPASLPVVKYYVIGEG